MASLVTDRSQIIEQPAPNLHTGSKESDAYLWHEFQHFLTLRIITNFDKSLACYLGFLPLLPKGYQASASFEDSTIIITADHLYWASGGYSQGNSLLVIEGFSDSLVHLTWSDVQFDAKRIILAADMLIGLQSQESYIKSIEAIKSQAMVVRELAGSAWPV